VTPPSHRVTGQAIFLFLAHYLGNLPSAPLVGWLSDSGQNLRMGMIIMPAFGLLAALLMLWGKRFVGRDVVSVRSPRGGQR
jgi:sugar phosphate permease